jgi:tetratricopeptide (TPR) repeat protein
VAHVTLAEIVLTLEWDWAGAEGHFREAIRLAPGDAYVRQPFARILSRQGRFDEAHQLLIEALDLDPLSKPAMNSIAYVYVSARRWEEALEACRRVLDIDPTYFETVACQAQAYSALGRHEEAIAASAVCRRVSRDSAAAVAVYAYFSGIAGRHEEARVLRDQLVERSQAGYVSPAFISFADIGLGEYEKAFERLNLACEIHDPFVTFLGVSPVFDPLRSDPRFPALLQKVGFPASFHPSVLHIRSTSRNT